MAKAVLPTNYVDDIIDESVGGGKRRYNLIQNSDGTYSLEDVTAYKQIGSDYNSMDINATNEAVNESADKNKILDTLEEITANTQPGYMAGALAVNEINTAVSEINSKIDDLGSKLTLHGKHLWNPSGGTTINIDVTKYKTLSLNVTNWSYSGGSVLEYPMFGSQSITKNGIYNLDVSDVDYVLFGGGNNQNVWSAQSFYYTITAT